MTTLILRPWLYFAEMSFRRDETLSGEPDALDSIVPMAFGNLALDLVLHKATGQLVSVRNGVYDNVPIEVVTGRKKVVDVSRYYNVERMRPIYDFHRQPIFIMTGDF